MNKSFQVIEQIVLSGHSPGGGLSAEAVERFERVVERQGGDLMVDEPIDSDQAREPDDRRFVLPRRREGESVDVFVSRITDATDRATT